MARRWHQSLRHAAAQRDLHHWFVLGLLSWFGIRDPRRVLEGLRDYAVANGSRHDEVLVAEARGRDFLLAHRLYRSHRTGAVVDPKMLRLTFPPRWRYDVLRGLDYFRAAAAPTDERLSDAVDIVASKRGRDGRWPLQRPHPGAVWFQMERPGQPSRWITLRALRVLSWWAGSKAGGPDPIGPSATAAIG